jgi:hypothetical protein
MSNQYTLALGGKKLHVVEFDDNTFEIDLANIDHNNYSDVLLVPRNTKYPTIDALILPNVLLQMTKKGKSHFIAATQRFIELLAKVEKFCKDKGIPPVHPAFQDAHGSIVKIDKRFGVFFAVPEYIYDKFGSQAVQCNEDVSEVALGTLTNRDELLKMCVTQKEAIDQVEKLIKNDGAVRKAAEDL